MKKIIVGVSLFMTLLSACPREDVLTFPLGGRRSALPPGIQPRYGFPVGFFYYPATEPFTESIVRLVVEELDGSLAFVSVNAQGKVIERGRGKIDMMTDPARGITRAIEHFPWEDWVISHCLKGGGGSWKIKRHLAGQLFAAVDGSCNGLVMEPAH